MVVALEKKQELNQSRADSSQLEQESLAEEEFDDFLSDDDATEEDKKVSYQDSDSDLDIPEDPYQVRTEKTFVNNPYNKGAIALLLVGSGVFFSMHLLRFLMGGYVSLGEQHSVTTNDVLDSEENSIFDEEVSQTPNQDLALHQALNQQSDEIKKVEKFNEALLPAPEPEPEPEPEQVTPPPQLQQPTPRTTPVRTVSNTPPPRPIPVKTNRAIPPKVVEKKEPIDPMQQWLLAASMGSYGASNFNTQQVSYNNGYNNAVNSPKPNSANIVSVSYQQESNPRVASYRQVAQQTSPSDANAVSQEVKTISPSQFMRGTTAKAEVELPIVWMVEGSQYNHQRDYLIRLSQPLLGSTGAEIAPEGSMAVVKASQFYGESGLIQLEVTSLIIEERGLNREYPVPPLSLIVLNKKGGILEAKADKGNNFDRQAASFLLSGVANTASVTNRPSSTFSNSFGSSTTYGERDIVGGFIQGVTDSAVDSLNQSQRNGRGRNDPTVYTIKAGTDVQLVVNKSFSLE